MTEQNRALTKKETILSLLEKSKGMIHKVAPKHMEADRMVRLAISAVNQSERLAECSPESLLGAFLAAAKMGLEPNTPLGHAWLVPYKGRATLIPGYKGYTHLAWQSDRVTNISTHIVYANEEFSYEAGTEERIKHIPLLNKDARGEPIGAYAVVHLKNSDKPLVRYMPQEEIESHRPSHWAKTPWNPKHEGGNEYIMLEMWRKTPLRAVLKLAPLSKELGYAISSDEGAQRGATWAKIGNDVQLVEGEDGVFTEDKPSAPPAGKKKAGKKTDKAKETALAPAQDEKQEDFSQCADQQS